MYIKIVDKVQFVTSSVVPDPRRPQLYRFTIAWKVVGVGRKFGLTYLDIDAGISFCSPLDKFDEDKGREEALKHMQAEPLIFHQAAGRSNVGMLDGVMLRVSESRRTHGVPSKVSRLLNRTARGLYGKTRLSKDPVKIAKKAAQARLSRESRAEFRRLVGEGRTKEEAVAVIRATLGSGSSYSRAIKKELSKT